jgi:hypothetical protein
MAGFGRHRTGRFMKGSAPMTRWQAMEERVEKAVALGRAEIAMERLEGVRVAGAKDLAPGDLGGGGARRKYEIPVGGEPMWAQVSSLVTEHGEDLLFAFSSTPKFGHGRTRFLLVTADPRHTDGRPSHWLMIPEHGRFVVSHAGKYADAVNLLIAQRAHEKEQRAGKIDALRERETRESEQDLLERAQLMAHCQRKASRLAKAA